MESLVSVARGEAVSGCFGAITFLVARVEAVSGSGDYLSAAFLLPMSIEYFSSSYVNRILLFQFSLSLDLVIIYLDLVIIFLPQVLCLGVEISI